jgi:hypothetical protein
MPARPDKKRQVESARKKLRSGERSTKAPAPKKKSFGVNVRDAAIGAAIGALGATGAGKGVKVGKVLYKGAKAVQGARLYRGNQIKNLSQTKGILKGKSKADILREGRKSSVDLARQGKMLRGDAKRGAKEAYGSGLRKDDISSSIGKAKAFEGVSKSRYNKLIDGGRK